MEKGDTTMLFRAAGVRPPKICFLCSPEDQGVIAPPVTAKTVFPDWFRSLPAFDRDHVTDGVERALGRKPRDSADHARETAATRIWSAPR
jgi:hypothetical protein